MEPRRGRSVDRSTDGGALIMSDVKKNAPNPFDPATLRISGGFAADAGAEKLLLILPVQKPNKQSFVRVNPVRRRMIWNIRGDFGAEAIGSSDLGYAALR